MGLKDYLKFMIFEHASLINTWKEMSAILRRKLMLGVVKLSDLFNKKLSSI
jgi:hypothetical protein